MAENPLLPNAELRALHQMLQRAEAAHSAAGKATRSGTGSMLRSTEALLAGTLLQLCEGDLLVTQGENPVATEILRSVRGKKTPTGTRAQHIVTGSSDVFFGAGLASALKRSGDRLALVVTQAGRPSTHWQEAVTWAQEALLPLVVVIADPSGEEAFRPSADVAPDTLGWSSLQRPAARLKLPILSVDGTDAVAVYRVMQESILRARSGGGPAVLWAVLPASRQSRGRPSASSTSLGRLEHFLTTRGIRF